MCRLIESIYLNDGAFRNLSYHEARINQSTEAVMGKLPEWSFTRTLLSSDYPKTGLYKTRLVYDQQRVEIEFVPYQIREINTLKLIETTLEYPHKFENREALHSVFEKRGGCDDAIMVRGGLITDATYANLIFKRANRWFTPAAPLLKGTMRQYLLDTLRIIPFSIRVEDLAQFESCKLINAMLGMEAPEIPITAIS